MDKVKKILVAMATVLVGAIPIIANSTMGASHGVHVALEVASAVLGVFGYTVTMPLMTRKPPEQK